MSLEDNINYVSIRVASANTIRSWSKGEVNSPETINYRTLNPEPGGLFCQRIFGPVRDYECPCGKYKRIKYKGIVCERCGVEITTSSVRSDRMGHIELAIPVNNILFLKMMPILLNMTNQSLERVIYYDSYIILEPGQTPLYHHQLISYKELKEIKYEYGENSFVAKIGGEALRSLLSMIDLKEELKSVKKKIDVTECGEIKNKLSKRIRIIQGFLMTNTSAECLILDVLPVIPPDLRPIVHLEGGSFATSDLNDLYRRVINRNNRLKSLLLLKTPEVIINNEKRMLQEAVDALLDNGRHGNAVIGPGNRPLKSLSDMLKGKQGRFRQNLLGKRVDYSGRSVIVIGPELKLHQCGLPKKMALILFEPFIIRRMKELGLVQTVREAQNLIEKRRSIVWSILESVSQHHPVLLNRAPTLHRLSIQAFEPILIEGNAIRLHPLVCTAYNADFDGDQMAVHVPLSIESIMECKLLMLSTHNILSPSNGTPILTPSQDIVLGAYYLTQEPKSSVSDGQQVPMMNNFEEAVLAKDTRKDFNEHTWVDFVNPDYNKEETIYGDRQKKVIRTTIGRIIFNHIWPPRIGFINFSVNKRNLGSLIQQTYSLVSKEEVVTIIENLKELGFKIATSAGISIGIDDMIIPYNKPNIINIAKKKIKDVYLQYIKGILTSEEVENQIIDIWTNATNHISNNVFKSLESNLGRKKINSVYLMMDSGARGNRLQVRQLCGLRGLMAKPTGEIIDQPVISSLREGLTVIEYFLSTHGARKGLSDTALKTADAGYLTRKLCDVAMDYVITEEYDGNTDGICKRAIYDGESEVVRLSDRIVGRSSSKDICNPNNKKEIIVKSGEIINDKQAKKIEELGIERVKIMSPITHARKNIIPSIAYGYDMSTGHIVYNGTAVGIIAAQSIGEPGTQLTLRTFHIGGIVNKVLKTPEIRVRNRGRIQYKGLRIVNGADGVKMILTQIGSVCIVNNNGKILEEHYLIGGAVLMVIDGRKMEKYEVLAMCDTNNIPILSEKIGITHYRSFIPGVTTKNELDSLTGCVFTKVIYHKEDKTPKIDIHDDEGNIIANYPVPVGAKVLIAEGDRVYKGSILANSPSFESQPPDITGGLLRVSELLEARNTKDVAYLSRIDGFVSLLGGKKRRIVITQKETGKEEEHMIPQGKHIRVSSGEFIYKGQPLTEGSLDPHDILEISGGDAVQEYLISEIQKIYRMQGVIINDKHIEIILTRMMRKVRITDPGESNYFWGEQVDKSDLTEQNKRIAKNGKQAESEALLLGITKSSMETDSFISAASFQETTRVLTDASTLGKVDNLTGLKENVIVGHLIPAGTGLPKYRSMKIYKI